MRHTRVGAIVRLVERSRPLRRATCQKSERPLATRSPVIAWHAPYGGLKLRGRKPDRAYAAGLELIGRFTTARRYAKADFHIRAHITQKLRARISSQGPWAQLRAAWADGLVDPHPAIEPALSAWGDPYAHLERPEAGGAQTFARLEWSTDAGDIDFESRCAAGLDLACRNADQVFESDVATVGAWFHFPSLAADLTVADGNALLSPRGPDESPEGFAPGIHGFASVPDGALVISLYLPFAKADARFAAYDAALGDTLGNFGAARYRLVSAGGREKKLNWKRRPR